MCTALKQTSFVQEYLYPKPLVLSPICKWQVPSQGVEACCLTAADALSKQLDCWECTEACSSAVRGRAHAEKPPCRNGSNPQLVACIHPFSVCFFCRAAVFAEYCARTRCQKSARGAFEVCRTLVGPPKIRNDPAEFTEVAARKF